MIILVLLLLAGLLYVTERWAYRTYWNHNLSVDLQFSAVHIDEGGYVDLEEIVSSRKYLPLPWLGLKLQLSQHLVFPENEFTTVSDSSYREELFSLGMFQQIRRRHHLYCSRRGYYTIRSVDLVSSDLLASCKLAQHQKRDDYLYVFPRPVPERELTIPFTRLNGEQDVPRHLVDDPFTFRGIREYLPTDPLRTINWKATAKTGDLMVNVRGYTARQSVELLVNMEHPSLFQEELLLEDSIRVASSLAERLTAMGFGVALRTNGPDAVSGEPVRVPFGSTDDHLLRINETLARIDIRQKALPFIDLLDTCLEDSGNDPIYVLLSAAASDGIQDRFRSLSDRSGQSLWILPVRQSSQAVPDAALRTNPGIFIREVVL